MPVISAQQKRKDVDDGGPSVILDGGSQAIASDGTRLFVVERGQGDAVLFIPGLGYATWSWHRQVGPISTIAKVLLMDNRGAGYSDKPAGPYSIPQMADDAYEVLRQRNAGPAHVVGASMGGYIALSLALRHPDAVQSLLLLATTSGGSGSRKVPEETLRAWAAALPLGSAGFARATMPLSFAPGWAEEHPTEFEELLALRLRASTPTDSWRSQFAACAAYLRYGLPPGPIDQPAVIVHGTADRVVPYENAAHLARRLPQASVITLRGAGHLCWIERSAAVNDIIRAVVNGHAPLAPIER
jgi:3-oxoadipate enol-lactonase